MIKVKLTVFNNSLAIELPKEVAEKLNVGDGDTIYLVESPNGYILTAYDPEFDEQVTTASGIMKRYKKALRDLSE